VDDKDSLRAKSVPVAMRARYEEISAITDDFCRAHLPDEFRDACREVTAALARKRTSPLVSGRAETWACAVALAVGRVNFIFDSSMTQRISRKELCKHFGISPSAGAAKDAFITETLRIGETDPKWTVPSRMEAPPRKSLILHREFRQMGRQLMRAISQGAFRNGKSD